MKNAEKYIAGNLQMPVLLVGFLEIDFGKPSALNEVYPVEGTAIKIGEIREIIKWVNTKPFGKEKVLIIKNIETMTLEAANSFLKTLEEPPSYCKIILTTLNEDKIISTIKSRCQILRKPYRQVPAPPEIYKDPKTLAKMSVAEKFQWAKEAAETEEIFSLITNWEKYYQEKLLQNDEGALPILIELDRAKGLLTSNISVKLLLENLTLLFDDKN